MEKDEKAFKELVYRNRDLIWSVCSSYRLSVAWTTHEVLCDLWRGFDGFECRSSERTWIFRLATNTMISITRRISNQPTTQAIVYSEPFYKDDDYRDLVEMIDATTEPDRTIIKAHVQGFRYAEIAQITGLSVAAVSMRLTRALRKLRKRYDL